MTTAGLEGLIAGRSGIATVGKAGAGLTYRGYRIEDLAYATSLFAGADGFVAEMRRVVSSSIVIVVMH